MYVIHIQSWHMRSIEACEEVVGMLKLKIEAFGFSIVLFKKKWVSLISRKHHSKQAFRIFVFWCCGMEELMKILNAGETPCVGG